MAEDRPCRALRVTSDTKAIIGSIIGTGLAVIAVVVTLVGGLRADMRAEIRDMRMELRDLRASMERFDDRLDAVEIALARVVQRLLTIERIILPPQAPR